MGDHAGYQMHLGQSSGAAVFEFDSMGWIDALVVWWTGHGVTLRGGRGLPGDNIGSGLGGNGVTLDTQ